MPPLSNVIAPYVAARPTDISQQLYADAAASIAVHLMTDPTTAVKTFRTFFKLQCIHGFEPFADSDTTTIELQSSFAFWVNIVPTLFDPETRSAILEKQYRDTIADAGLHDAYVDIILWPGFFSQSQRFINDVLVGLAHTGMHIPKQRRESLLWPRAPELWAHIWQHRLDLEWWTSVIHGEDAGDVAQQHSVSLVLMSLNLYVAWCKSTELVNTCIPHVILYSVATHDGPSEDLVHLGLKDIITNRLLPIFMGLDYNDRVGKVESLLQEAIIDTVGMDMLFGRLGEVLRDKVSVDYDVFTLCVDLLALLCCSRKIDTMPYLIRHDIVALFVANVMGSRLEDGRMSFTLSPNAPYLFHGTTTHCIFSKTPIIHGEDAIGFLSACLDTWVATSGILLSDDFKTIIWDCIAKYHDVVKSIKGVAPREPSAVTLVEGMKAGALVYWWPTLARLRKAKGHRDSSIALLYTNWKELGLALGLTAKQEHQRHQEEERTSCSWRNCPHRGLPTGADDKPALRKCAGCGEVRYCSRECQLSHWKQGGHKARCKRLKN